MPGPAGRLLPAASNRQVMGSIGRRNLDGGFPRPSDRYPIAGLESGSAALPADSAAHCDQSGGFSQPEKVAKARAGKSTVRDVFIW